MSAKQEDPPVLNWAEELEDQLVPQTESATRRIGDRKFVTEFKEDDEGKKKKIVTEYRIVTKRVPKAVAERKMWRKFGEASNDGPGPQTYSTVVAEEIPIQFLTGREDIMGADTPAMGLKDKAQVTCRTCGGEHWTTQCQFRGHSEAEKEAIREKFLGVKAAEAATEMPSNDGGGGKYVAPSRRPGAVMPSGGMSQDQLPSIRVSNLPTDVKEDDLRDLFENFGRIKKVYLGKDKKTGDFKGFAFVTFFEQSSADKAILKVNGHKYFHMILSVDWANPSKP